MPPRKGASVLVIGGAGPTGRPLIEGLLARGQNVTMLHSGTHRPSEDWYTKIDKIYANAFDESSLSEAVAARSWDSAFVMYGRLRVIVRVLSGRVKRLITVGGVSVYRGFAVPELLKPHGMLVPQMEDTPKSTHDGSLFGRPDHPNPKVNAIVETERIVFEVFPQATHFRYPAIYGDDAACLWDWSIVRRILDGRRKIVLADDGLTLQSRVYTKNAAKQLLLAFDRPEVSEGEVYNAGDEQTLTCKQWVEVIAEALGANLEVISMPADLAVPAWPLLRRPTSSHEAFSIGKLRWQLGYRDEVSAAEATALTARFLATHPISEQVSLYVLQDPFDYEKEDELIEAWQRGDLSAARAVRWRVHPGFTLGGYSSDVNPFDGMSQHSRHEGVYDPTTQRRSKL